MRLVPIGDFDQPVFVTAPRNDPRLFVVERTGRIITVANGKRRVFLDISDRVSHRLEQGLYSIAFHPDFGVDRSVFVSYTDREGKSRVERYHVSANPDSADNEPAELVVMLAPPYGQHNGGQLLFDERGLLWLGTGDGGYGADMRADPDGNAQSESSPLGKMLAIDVSTSPARVAVRATGLRNPWRFDIDSGRLFVADVGHFRYEEIHVEPTDSGVPNFGWPVMEGPACYEAIDCVRAGFRTPKVTYPHSVTECSVIGGLVYRGRSMRKSVGHYFYSDYCGGWLRSFRFDGGVREHRRWKMPAIGGVVSFGEDAAQELYIIAERGSVYRLAAP